MKVIALIIGNSNYNDPDNKLKNAVKDAEDISLKFEKLGYKVLCHTNITNQEMDEAIYNFGIELNSYDIGIFYYAGHGMQIEGENFLTAIDTNFAREIDAKYSSMPLNKLLDTMDVCDNSTNIIILDACRDNPFEKAWSRSVSSTGLAPVYAPKGSLIAYATSPGQKASDGVGDNGLYTSMLLKNLEKVNITIEEFFKQVRNSVFAFSGGKQTTWEHTSLTGTFYFNNGVYFNENLNEKYTDTAIKDSEFKLSDSDLSKIIKDLKSHNWYVQNPAIQELLKLEYDQKMDKNELFILGRNFLQTANGGENLARELIEDLESWIGNFNTNDNENYFLDGILFEIYFDSNGIFRDERLKDFYISNLYSLQMNDNYAKSFNFIEKELLPFTSRNFFYLKFKNQPIQLDLIFDKKEEQGESIYDLKDVMFEGSSVLKLDKSIWLSDDNAIRYQPILKDNLHSKISQLSKIPRDFLNINSNYDHEFNLSSKINVPIGYIIKK